MLLFATILFGFHGIIENDTTWSDTASLTGDVLVDSGITLTIAPGTVVLCADNCEWDTSWVFGEKKHPKGINGAIDLIVEGNLKAIGMINDSIYLSEFKGFSGPCNIILVDGVDSLAFCNITIGEGEVGGLVGWGYPGLAFSNVEVSISHSLFNGGYGMWGEKSIINVNNTEFRSVFACMYCDYSVFAGTGNLIKLDSGCLYIGSCSIFNTDILAGSVIMASDLDSCVVKSTVVSGADGYGTGDAPPPTGADDAGGCKCLDCHYVEIVNCTFEGIRGGDGDAGAGVGRSGGDGFGVYLRSCNKVLLKGNSISDISGGSGGSSLYGGAGGDAIGVYLEDCGDVMIDENRISDLWKGYGGSGEDRDGPDGTPEPLVCSNSNPEITNNEFNSNGIYIYIDPMSYPRIGGELGKGNRFLNLQDRGDYVIYNDSPFDIIGTWNYWEPFSQDIDSLIFDYYDDETKGIVHYQPIAGIEERKDETSPSLISVNSIIASDVLEVQLHNPLGRKLELSLFDAAGRKVHSQTVIGSKAEVDVSVFPRGVYFVCVMVEGSRITRRVIVY